ncbi:hypothetical protein LQ567_03640 [Niabella pedocola]|uniref:Uncharacterized protein n=1 Tax=Niabella pedocola TaxID=1752077 RepID=A0ABS8PL60_9BACT|nr:hypothetical protein [Niabella pedocola]MCD2421839.1 hypothetical protein [Niabella pedocola]
MLNNCGKYDLRPYMHSDHLERSIAFIRSIGIPVTEHSIAEATFLPGILISEGGIIIDKERLQYPGDVLHEAGHIAVIPAAERATVCGAEIAARPERAAEEMMAIAWSYAACKYLNIDPYFVFHDEGYQNGGKQIADQFEAGQWFGVPMLQYAGMTAEPQMAAALNRPAYPAMIQWLRS